MFGEPFSKKAGLMMRLDVDYGDEVEESSVEPGSKTALDKPVQVRSKEMGSRCEAPAPPPPCVVQGQGPYRCRGQRS